MMHTAGSHENQNELEQFLQMLSPTIKNKVSQHIFLEAFLANGVFSDHKGLIQNVITGLIPYLMRPEDTVMQ